MDCPAHREISPYNTYGHNFKQLVLTLGYRCNMNCKSCFLGGKLNDHVTELSYEDCISGIESAARLQTIESVAFVGGEPFVYYPLMLRVASYLNLHYRCPLNVTTNATWAKTPAMTKRLLDPLYERGMRYLMVSLDDYHLENGYIEQSAHCIKHCQELDIQVSVQVINRRGAATKDDYQLALSPQIDVDAITWYSNPCSALGNAQTMLSKDDFEWHEEIPLSGCSAGEILNIQPDGEIKPCCGAGLMSSRLSLGNSKREGVCESVRLAEADPVINSLVGHQGPHHLANALTTSGYAKLVAKHAPFSDACHACHALLSDPDIVTILDRALEEGRIELLANRVIAMHGNRIFQEINT